MGESHVELSELPKQVGEDLTDEYDFKFCEAVGEVEPTECAPFEVWRGLAHALADVSGYRIVLQTAVLEPIPEERASFRTIGWKDVASVEPNLFVETD